MNKKWRCLNLIQSVKMRKKNYLQNQKQINLINSMIQCSSLKVKYRKDRIQNKIHKNNWNNYPNYQNNHP